MKIKRYFMEDWLNDSRQVQYNLSSSGCEDFYLKELLELCNTDISELNKIFLGDNDTFGSFLLREEICKSYSNVKPDDIMVSNGSSEALFIFFNELLEEGDEVVVPFPAFQCLYEIPVSIGCNMKYLNLLECEGWKLDIGKLDSLVTPKTKLIIINNPHNPFGWTLNEGELMKIGEIAAKNNCYLLFDEHYRYLPLKQGTELISSGYDICKSINPKTFASGSMIKCFGIVGIRIGWLIGERQVLLACRDFKDYMTHTAPELTDYIAYISLKNKEKIIETKKKHILSNLERLNCFMKNNSSFFKYVPPTGGVVCFPEIKADMAATDFCKELFEKFSISLLPGFSFEVDKHFRMNIGINSGTFNEALDKMHEFMNSLYSKK